LSTSNNSDKANEIKNIDNVAQIVMGKFHSKDLGIYQTIHIQGTLERIRQLMWAQFEACKDPLKKTIILEKIKEIQPYLTAFMDAMKGLIEHKESTTNNKKKRKKLESEQEQQQLSIYHFLVLPSYF
jgi:hypothetical protein